MACVYDIPSCIHNFKRKDKNFNVSLWTVFLYPPLAPLLKRRTLEYFWRKQQIKMSRLGIHVITDNHFSADMFVNMGIKKGKMVLINTKNLSFCRKLRVRPLSLSLSGTLLCIDLSMFQLDTTCQQLLDRQSYFYLSTTWSDWSLSILRLKCTCQIII